MIDRTNYCTGCVERQRELDALRADLARVQKERDEAVQSRREATRAYLNALASAQGMRAALVEARESIVHWAAYADEHYRQKWDLAGDLARIAAALTATPPSAAGASEHTDRNCCCAVHMGPTDACPRCPAHGAPTPPAGPALGALVDRVVEAAVRVVNADTYKHPVLSREDAVKAGVAELHDAVNAYRAALPPTEATPR